MNNHANFLHPVQPFPIDSAFMKSFDQLFRAVRVTILLLGLSACRPSTQISTQAAGHAITANLEGSHSLDTQPDRVVITGEFGKITVEPARVRLGDGPWTKIHEQVPIEVGIAKHKRWITAGGVRIKETD